MNYLLGSFRKYAEFNGRARRSEFWTFAAFFVVVLLGANYVDALDGNRVPVAAGMGVLELSASLLLLLPFLSSGARRLHDTGRSGWWMLLLYVPYLGWIASRGNMQGELVTLGGVFVGFVALVILLVLPGDPMENRFGPNPRGLGSTSDKPSSID
jgi:uncharacterized membrane protein YhaH (DUF805 family)